MTTYAIVDTDKGTIKVSSVSMDSIYNSGDIRSDTIASVKVNGITYDAGTLSRADLGPSFIQAGTTQLGSTTMALPPGYGFTDVTVVTVTNYEYDAGYGIW